MTQRLKQKLVVTTANLAEHFRGLVESAMTNQRVNAKDVTEFYIIDLLANFLRTERLYPHKNPYEEEPLSLRFYKAIAQKRVERIRLLKEVGDVSLYISGFFPDSLNRRLVDVDYYISMGEQSYSTLSKLMADLRKGEHFHELFAELSQKFSKFVDVLAEVSERSAFTTNRDILRIYEKWLRTRSTRLAKLLREKGIIANPYVAIKFLH